MGGGFFMNKRNIALVISMILVLLVSACTTYQPYEPTGEVVGEPEVVEEGSGEPEELTDEELEELLAEILGEETPEEEPEAEVLEEEVTEEEAEVTEEPTEEVVEEEIEEEVVEEVVEEEVTEEEPELILEEPEEVDITAVEGDLVDLKPYVMDPDGDEVTLEYTVPFDEKGMWQTEVGDEGFYSLIVTATDGKDSFVPKQFTVTILPANKPPVINIGDVLKFDEGDLVKINPDVYDEDGDEVVVLYSGWMSSKTYQTDYDDAGNYEVTIRADDGQEIVSKTVKVVVSDVNRKPELTVLNDARIEVTEEDLVEIDAEAVDADGDKVEITFSRPLDEDGEWQTKRGDAGAYVVQVLASDGVNTVESEVLIEVLKKNTPPVIESLSVNPEYVELRKPGDKVTINLALEASDPDGDEISVFYSGYMDLPSKVVSYGDKGGLKTVTVTVSDGKDSTSERISFEMNNWPCFECLE